MMQFFLYKRSQSILHNISYDHTKTSHWYTVLNNWFLFRHNHFKVGIHRDQNQLTKDNVNDFLYSIWIFKLY